MEIDRNSFCNSFPSCLEEKMEFQGDGWKSSRELVDQGFERIQKLMKQERKMVGLDTGFSDINTILSGLQRGKVVIIGSRPGMGKSLLSLNIGLNIAKGAHGVGIFSLAESAPQIMMRLISMESQVPMTTILNGRINKETELPKIMDACETLYSLPIVIQEDSCSIEEIEEQLIELKHQQENLGVVIVDYIGLVQSSNYLVTQREAIAAATRRLKHLARKLQICILVISQLNRSLEQRIDKRPILSDLRGTGALEQDADVVCFLYREEYYYVDTPEKGVAELIVAKQRIGPTGTVKLQFDGEYLQFSDRRDHFV